MLLVSLAIDGEQKHTGCGVLIATSVCRWGSRSASAVPSLPRCQTNAIFPQTHPLTPPQNTRRGRGQGSTKGGTAGRGHKGQLARSGNGKPGPGFEGGQTPITRLFPKRGFVNQMKREYAPLSIATLQRFIQSGRIDPSQPITIGTVVHSNAVHGLSKKQGIKLLGTPNPDLPLPALELELSRFSKSSAQAVIDAGGKVTAVYRNALALRQEVFPHKFDSPIKIAEPIRRTDIGELGLKVNGMSSKH